MTNNNSEIRKIAFIADYLPRKCGIATFTKDLHQAVATAYPETECIVAAVNDIDKGYDYPSEVRFELMEQDPESYRRAADYLNFSNSDVASIQHEFGIYGGPAGSHILGFARDLRMPLVTTLHTILQDPTPDQRQVMDELASLSSRLVVMTERGKSILSEIYGVSDEKIDLIPHGIPDMAFVDPNYYKAQFGVDSKFVVLTFGLLSPNKGIENVLKALPKVLQEFPNLVYIVLGATHPNLLREAGETYRLSLERLAQDLGIQKNVIFYNRFVELNELMEFIGATDLYITPYLNPNQATSGTLAYSFGCGKAVISTPYWHAEELLAEGRGVLVPFSDAEAIAKEIVNLLRDEPGRHAMRRRAYMLGREMVWSNVAKLYMESFQKARIGRPDSNSRPLRVRTLDEKSRELPPVRLDHLRQMTDSTGILQHATYMLPNLAEGYCADDNARALILTVLLEGAGYEPREVSRLTSIYAAFMNYAFDHEHKKFRNFMSYSREWLENEGSDDSQGRSLWALGVCVGRSKNSALRMWAASLFEQALPAIIQNTSPRSWAFALLGIHEYFRRMSGDRFVSQMRDALTHRLIELYEQVAGEGWFWFENTVSYDNAVLPHALLLSGRWSDNPIAYDIGLRSLRWLTEIQRAEDGHFRPIGSDGFYHRGDKPAQFDQQPLEACSLILAALEAYRATKDEFWLNTTRTTFDWFLGHNDGGQEIYDSSTGGCRDGLHLDRANQNQGAESTLAFLQSRLEMELLENSLSAFRKPEDPLTTAIIASRSLEPRN